MTIKKFAELDENSIVVAIHDYPTEEGWTAPSFLVEIKPPMIAPNVGKVYKEGVFVDKSMVVKELQQKLFNPVRNKLFADTAWVRERAADLKEFDRLNVRTLTAADIAKWKEWLKYWQALRDMPTQVGFDPASPAWPKQPV